MITEPRSEESPYDPLDPEHVGDPTESAVQLDVTDSRRIENRLAAELTNDHVLVNSVCPGRPPPDDGPTDGFFREGRPLPF